ncbi:MAG: serine/threonine protein kinase [Victivallales bacterium]|nr:serine/threonine protein kinase [Victivallales bacterium]MCF7888507.1 serine/threonine protein kinase [Victivallales bacterium]
MVLKWFKNQEKNRKKSEVDVSLLNKGYMACENCLSQYLLSFYKPLSFTKCTRCGCPMFIPHQVSDYWLIQPLGSGGMGSVYKAIHHQNARKYSVKLLQRDNRTDPEVIQNLLHEGKVGKEISDHPNLCPVIEFGNKNNEIYIVSKFLEGIRLDILVDTYGPVKEETVLKWGLQLLSALQYIYKKGYLYRDTKPQNIIISKNKEDAVLFDYGLAVEIEGLAPEEEEHIIGSPMFLPPERCVFDREDMYSEIYSLGMVLFYCLAGNPYYESSDVKEIISMHTRKIRMKTVSALLKNINPDIVDILDKMLKRNPEDRYQTYKEAYNDIKQIYDIYRF